MKTFAHGRGRRDPSCRLRLRAAVPAIPATKHRRSAAAGLPFYQQGSGQRAGGPANELNTNGPMTTGTIVVPVPAEPMPPSGVVGVEVMPGAPQALDGKGQAAGGYVGEAKRRDGIQ